MKKLLAAILVSVILTSQCRVVPVLAKADAPAAVSASERLISSVKELYAALDEQTLQLNRRFKLEISSALDVEKIIQNLANTAYSDFEAVFEYYIDGAGNKVKADFYTYEFAVMYFDHVAALTAFKDPAAESKLSESEKKLLKKAKEVIKKLIKPDMTEYEKTLAIHDYLILNAKYDDRVDSNSEPERSHYASGVLLHGVGVCDSYAKAACLLLNMADVECVLVNGTADGVGHAWNKVKLEGDWYNLDVTWDDPSPDRPGEVRRGFFCVTDAELKRTHKWEAKDYPKAVSEKYAYYRYNGLVSKSYDDFKQIVTSLLDGGGKTAALYVKNYSESSYSLDFLYERYNVQKYRHNVPRFGAEGEMLIYVGE